MILSMESAAIPLAVWGAAHRPSATIGSGDGLKPLGLEVAEVFDGVSPTVGIGELDHRFGDGAVVESIASRSSSPSKR
jgi:hypothetical protein